MRGISGALAALTALLLCAAEANAASRDGDEPPLFDATICQPSVTTRLDNDIDQEFERMEPLSGEFAPAPVRDKLIELGNDFILRAGDARLKGMTCERMIPRIFKIAVNSRQDLYVAFVRDVYGYRYVMMAHDRQTGRVSPKPIQYSARALRGVPPLEKPYVSLIDLRKDGKPQIVFEEPTRFFEIYLGVIYHYFDIGPDMELIHVMARETRFRDSRYNGARFNRDLTVLDRGRIRLETTLVSDDGSPRPLGYVELQSKKHGAAFKVVRRRALTPEFYSDLVTIEARNPDFAIQEGAEERFLRAE